MVATSLERLHACMHPQRSAVEFAVVTSQFSVVSPSTLKLMQAKLYADNEISTPGEICCRYIYIFIICDRLCKNRPCPRLHGSNYIGYTYRETPV